MTIRYMYSYAFLERHLKNAARLCEVIMIKTIMPVFGIQIVKMIYPIDCMNNPYVLADTLNIYKFSKN